MKARVTVTLKSGILDAQGKAIEGALKSLGVDGIASVRQGKVFDIELSGADKAKAEAMRFKQYVDSPVLASVSVRFDGLSAYPACKAYVARAVARPAFRKAHADQLAHFAAGTPPAG